VVQLLLEANADIESKGNDGQRLLSWVAENEHDAVVRQLLAICKADVDSKDNDGLRPLVLAAVEGSEAVVKLLLAAGKIDVDLKDNDGWMPLASAARYGYEAVVRPLLEGNADGESKLNKVLSAAAPTVIAKSSCSGFLRNARAFGHWGTGQDRSTVSGVYDESENIYK
jgi:ankyrin repeat protein